MTLLIPLTVFGRRDPQILVDESERIHLVIQTLKETEPDSKYQRAMWTFLELARMTLPLVAKTAQTTLDLQSKLRRISAISSPTMMENAVPCLTALTLSAAGEHLAFLHRNSREDFSFLSSQGGKEPHRVKRALTDLGLLWQTFHFDRHLPAKADQRVCFLSFVLILSSLGSDINCCVSMIP